MMTYKVKRLERGDGIPAGYHLFDQSETLLFVADPGLAQEAKAMRFARPDGTLCAMMNVPKLADVEYALIQDFAVYAMFNRLARPEGMCLIFEVASERWLIRPEAEGYVVYDGVPAGYPDFLSPEDVVFPDACGHIVMNGIVDYHFSVSFERHYWWQVGLVMLAVITLLDEE